MRRFKPVLTAIFVLALVAPGLALAAPKPPEQLARETVQTVLQRMDGHREELKNNPQKLHDLIDQELLPLVDLPYMSQLVLGRAWRTATPDQRKRFQAAFKNMLISTYGNGLLAFDDDTKVDYLPVRAPKDAQDITFNAIVTPSDGQKTRVTFQMHVVDGQWKIYDGSVGNLSFVTNYRGQFNSQIRRNGLESLIEKMEAKYGS